MINYQVASIVIYTLAGIGVILTTIAIKKYDKLWALFYVPCAVLCLLGLITLYPAATERDLQNGMAELHKHVNVTTNQNGDTINSYTTYTIEWKKEFEYGRKNK